MARKSLPQEIEAAVLLRSRRRCALCFGLKEDREQKAGQIAHIDQDSSNNTPDNLVFLCLEHHDAYDSRTISRRDTLRRSYNITARRSIAF
jgi:hypothetical protein